MLEIIRGLNSVVNLQNWTRNQYIPTYIWLKSMHMQNLVRNEILAMLKICKTDVKRSQRRSGQFNAYAKFDLTPSICSQDIERKHYSDDNQGPLFCRNL